MLTNIVVPGKPQMTIRRMRIACWNLRLQTHTQIMYYLLLFQCNNVCKNAPRCYVLLTLPALFNVKTGGSLNKVTARLLKVNEP
jgi:hypothetical protein